MTFDDFTINIDDVSMIFNKNHTFEQVSAMKKMPVGIDDFKKIREENYYFVDKTRFIQEFIDNHSQVTLITRPRRFGKTLILSMLKCFFSLENAAENKKLFLFKYIKNRLKEAFKEYDLLFNYIYKSNQSIKINC